jgi:hypothetical protein
MCSSINVCFKDICTEKYVVKAYKKFSVLIFYFKSANVFQLLFLYIRKHLQLSFYMTPNFSSFVFLKVLICQWEIVHKFQHMKK